MNYLVEFENSRRDRVEHVVFATDEAQLKKIADRLEERLSPAGTWTLLSYMELDPS